MIQAKNSSGGRSRRDVLIFAPYDLRHGASLSARSVQHEKHELSCLADIWARQLDLEDSNLLGII